MGYTIATYLETIPHFTTFMNLIKFAGLYQVLHETKNITVFASPNAVFEKMGSVPYELLINRNRDTLNNRLIYHIARNEYLSGSLVHGGRIQAMNGKDLAIYNKNGILRINNSVVTQPDQRLDNGILYILDSMLQERRQKNIGYL